MIVRPAAVSAALVAAGVLYAGHAAGQDNIPSFRTRVELVSLNVTVTDPEGRYVTDLDRDAFHVFEDGAQQEITFFSRTHLPVALSILMDTSASMEDKLQTAQEAAIGFIRRLRPQDVAQLIDFDSRVQIAMPFTNDIAALEAAIRRTSAGGSTSLHNAIYISLKELKKIRAASADEIRRQAIVVLSDGEDTSSLVGFDEVLELAKRSETAVYAIGLRSRDYDRRRSFSEADFVLRQLAQQTGGRVFFPKEASELSGVYERIAEELSSQYTIGYTSRNPKLDGAWRRIVVRVNHPNLTARTKQGYYGPVTN
ncbi:MAG TPA: VWA domain-containing protein [Vicinamibacterales bacterium]|nr:VWA domain-containing protein [Vicinamibacterales bacterium]